MTKEGDHVEITDFPFQGRTGVVRKRRHFLFMRMWEVWCDDPDLLGRRKVLVRHVKETEKVK